MFIRFEDCWMLGDCSFFTHETVVSQNTLLKTNRVFESNISLFNRKKTLLKGYGWLFIHYKILLNIQPIDERLHTLLKPNNWLVNEKGVCKKKTYSDFSCIHMF